jgi:hypothetical protein
MKRGRKIGDELIKNSEFVMLTETQPWLSELRRVALMNTVFYSKETYERRHARFVRIFGNDDFVNLLQYIHTEKVCVATKRQMMSIIYHMRYVLGRPISMCLAVDIDRQLDGLESVEAKRPPRGAIDRLLFGDIIKYIDDNPHHEYLKEGLEVQFGLCCRGPSVLPVIEATNLDLKGAVAHVPRKGTSQLKRKEGELVPVPIGTKEAYDILVRRARRTPFGPLFPEWKAKEVNDLIKKVAVAFGWDVNYQWSSHSIRHGAAMQYTEEFLEKMRRAGGWKANSSAYRYMRLRLQRRADGTDDVEFESVPEVEQDDRVYNEFVSDDGFLGLYELNPAYLGGEDDDAPIVLALEGVRPPVRMQLEPIEAPLRPGEEVAGRGQPTAEAAEDVSV